MRISGSRFAFFRCKMIRQSTVLVPECADFRVPICDFSPENDPPINSFSSWVCGFSGSFLVQEGSKRDILRKLPEGPSMSRAHIPFGKIGFWPDRHRRTDRQTDTGRTKKLEPSYTIAPSGQLYTLVLYRRSTELGVLRPHLVQNKRIFCTRHLARLQRVVCRARIALKTS